MMKKLLKIVLALIIIAAVALTIFWFARPADVSFDEVRASVPNSEYSHFADIDGVRIHYQEKGTGTPLVLIHGYTSLTYTWKDVFEPLSQSFRVIAVDLKGFGFSGKPDGDYTRRAQAVLVAHLLEHLNIDKAWLCGNSMGGEVALNVALANPQRVAGLILIDSAGVEVPGRGTLAPGYLQLPVLGRLLIALSLTSDKLVRQGLEKSFYDHAKVTPDRVASYYRPLQTRGGQLAALRARAQWSLFPVEPNLGKINVPTLILWGAQDQLIPLAAGRKLNSLIKDSSLVIFDNCGHLPQEEMPARTIDEVTKFITPRK
ncbi:MAG TPA: alpha/beta hydrolase [Pyrinomonadaceae bacterium]|jgi:pimeloyl-ACP methyl ester carboxylesterase|nr:alpha/beta hydrolase [Pyrinomonadaceae bacterium]